MTEPQFQHDCDDCIFLGTANVDDRDYDLYYADHGGIWEGTAQTVIARYGDEGPDYTSGLYAADLHMALAIAKQRAEERGLLKAIAA